MEDLITRKQMRSVYRPHYIGLSVALIHLWTFFQMNEPLACGLQEFDCSTVHDLGLLAMPLTFVSTSALSPDCTYLSSFSFSSSASASVKGRNPNEETNGKELVREPQPFGHQHYLYYISKEEPVVTGKRMV